MGRIENHVWERDPQGGNLVIVVIDDDCGFALQDPNRIHAAHLKILPLLREYSCSWEETRAIGFFKLLNTTEYADRMLEVIEDWIRGLSVQGGNVCFLVDFLFGTEAGIAGPHMISRLENTYRYSPEQFAYLTHAARGGVPPAGYATFGKADQTEYAQGAGSQTKRFHPNLMSFFGI